jgi:hypothetical protein
MGRTAETPIEASVHSGSPRACAQNRVNPIHHWNLAFEATKSFELSDFPFFSADEPAPSPALMTGGILHWAQPQPTNPRKSSCAASSLCAIVPALLD